MHRARRAFDAVVAVVLSLSMSWTALPGAAEPGLRALSPGPSSTTREPAKGEPVSPDMAVPDDGSWLEVPLTDASAPQAGTVLDVTVRYQVEHADPTQLELRLEKPGSDVSVVIWDHGQAPAGGQWGESASLAAFSGAASAGEWRLLVRDSVPGVAGRLLAVSLDADYAPLEQAPILLAGAPGQADSLSIPADIPASDTPDGNADKAAAASPAGRPSALLAPDWEVIFSEGFEAAWPGTGWSRADYYPGDEREYLWDDVSNMAHTGGWSAWPAAGGANGLNPAVSGYPPYMNSWMIYGAIDLSGYEQAKVSWWMWYYTESPWDKVAVRASSDGVNYSGLSWSGTPIDEGWYSYELDLTAYAGDASVWVAWVFESDYSIQYAGAYVDDIEISGKPACTPPAPTLASPANGSSTVERTPTLTWNQVLQVQGYHLQLDNDADFSSPIADNAGLSPTSTSYTVATPLDAGTYYWRVRAGRYCDTGGPLMEWVDGPWSAAWGFVIYCPPSTVTITLSANPAEGGNPTGAGTYYAGTAMAVNANPAPGYSFQNWSEGGTIVSTAADYSFTATADRDLVANYTASPAASLRITFEEAIPQPDAVRSQYCNNPASNCVGLEFLGTYRIHRPSVATASAGHALTNRFPSAEFGEFDTMAMRFTEGQSSVSLKVGLDRAYSFAVTARIDAYSGADAQSGLIGSSTVLLGNGPTAIATNLAISSDSGNILSVRITFAGPSAGQAAFEEIDDIAFSVVGPSCVSDGVPPSVSIEQPAPGQVMYLLYTTLGFSVIDLETGVARIRVAFLDSGGSELEGFDVCGTPASASCLYDVVPTHASSHFYTYLPRDTARVRVQAWDFGGTMGQDEHVVDLRLPSADTNLWAMGMEITQATQSWVATAGAARGSAAPVLSMPSTAVPLVFGRRTVVRVYPGVQTAGAPVEMAWATLACQADDSGAPCPGSNPIAPSGTITVDPANSSLDSLREQAARSWNFTLPLAWTLWGRPLRLTATVNVPGGYECPGCVDGANSITVSSVSFSRTAPLDLHLIYACVRRHAGDATSVCDSSPLTAHNDIFLQAQSLFARTLPVAETDIRVTLHNPLLVPFDGSFTIPDGSGAMTSDRMYAFHAYVGQLGQLDAGAPLSSVGIGQIYFGVVPAPVTAILGLGSRNVAIAKVDPASLAGDIETSTEEVGHALGRPHASCDHDEGGCEAAPAVFPCTHGGICTYGFDTFAMSAIAPGDTSQVNGHAHDFMSYGGPPWWISPYTYTHLYNALHNALPAGSTVTAGAVSTADVLWVSGSVFPGSAPEQGLIQPAYRLGYSQPLSLAEGAGSYSIELRGPTGQLLYVRYLEPQLLVGDPPDPTLPATASFSEALPYSEAIASVVLKHGGQVLATRQRSANPPTVTLLQPAAGEVWDTGAGHVISWEGSDADDDVLHYLVQYSRDDGAAWSTVAQNWPTTSLEIDSSQLAGGASALVRVLASDGLSTAVAVSGQFGVANKPPLPLIISPAGGGPAAPTYAERALVVLEGTATDREDGPLAGESLSWVSQRDGALGSGNRLDTTRLSVGSHEITLVARDSQGLSATDTLTLVITPRINNQPLADAGPDRTTTAGTAVTLDGSASRDPEADRLYYSWAVVEQPAGSRPQLTDAEAVQPDFSADRPGLYRVGLVVSDGEVASVADYAAVQVRSGSSSVYLPAVAKNASHVAGR